jgi:hypothetical protein
MSRDCANVRLGNDADRDIIFCYQFVYATCVSNRVAAVA